jgi:hypothetical protein
MHVYKREFAISDGTELFMPEGETALCFEIGFPAEGKITRLIVAQSPNDVTATAFSVDLFDRAVCEVAVGSSVSGSEPGDDMTSAIAKIIPTQHVVAGDVMELRSGHGYSYRNREGSFTVPVRKVYLQIDVDSTSIDTYWEVAIECEVGNESN